MGITSNPTLWNSVSGCRLALPAYRGIVVAQMHLQSNCNSSMLATAPQFPDIEIPNVDIWKFLFERQKEFPNNKGYPDYIPHVIPWADDV
jgi:hypothetical protein